MEKYVDGYVLPIKIDKLKEYTKMAGEAGNIWMKHGALAYYECVGEDLNPNMGGCEYTKFYNMTNNSKDETIIFAFVIYKSKKHRDDVLKKVMSDPSMDCPEEKMKDMPFDIKRMAYGGFKTIVSLE